MNKDSGWGREVRERRTKEEKNYFRARVLKGRFASIRH